MMISEQDVLANTLAVYNELGTQYETAYNGMPGQIASLEWLLSHLAPKSHILDIGSGTGRPVASTLSAAGHSVHGIDLSPTMVAAARERVPAGRFEEIDSRAFEAPDGEYDAITAYYSYLVGVSQNDTREVFPRAHRWLKPGGLFVWGTVVFGAHSLDLTPWNWIGRSVYMTSLSLEEMERCIRDAGFEIVQSEMSKFKATKAAESGICSPEELVDHDMVHIYARKLA